MSDDFIPISFYEEYWDDLPGFSRPVQQRLRTFLELVGFDPDDRGLLDVCQTRRVWFHRVYAYPLAEGYVVFWRVKRERPRLLSLKLAPPREIVATSQRGFRLIDGGQDFRAATFPLLPQRKSSFTASSSPRSRPLSIACRTNALWSGVSCTSICRSLGAGSARVKHTSDSDFSSQIIGASRHRHAQRSSVTIAI